MGHIPILEELAVITGIGVLITLILARLKLPTVAGLLTAGAVIGPQGLSWVHEASTIETLAEMGVGIAIVPNHVAAHAIEQGKVVALEVERRTKPATNAIYLAWRRTAREAARVKAVRQALAAT